MKVGIEQVRAFWEDYPCNRGYSNLSLGSREYFDEIEKRKYIAEPHIPGFAEFKRWKGKRVLEIGCGIGTDTVNFAREGAYVDAVDLSESSIALAHRRVRLENLSERVRFHVADAEYLSSVLRPQRYDLVYAFGVLHHTPDPEKIIEQILRNYTVPGSVLKLMLYHLYSLRVARILLRSKIDLWTLGRDIAEYSEAQVGCPISRTYSHRGIHRLLGSGFRILEMRNGSILPLTDRRRRYLPPFLLRWLERRLGWHVLVTAEVVRL